MIVFTYHILERSERMAKTKQEINKQIDEWQRKNVRRIVIKLNKRTDADILEQLDKEESVQGYIKKAVRAYMK